MDAGGRRKEPAAAFTLYAFLAWGLGRDWTPPERPRMFAADMSTAASPSRGSARRELARLIEHPARQPGLTASELERICSAAVESGFFGVCVNSSRVVQ